MQCAVRRADRRRAGSCATPPSYANSTAFDRIVAGGCARSWSARVGPCSVSIERRSRSLAPRVETPGPTTSVPRWMIDAQFPCGRGPPTLVCADVRPPDDSLPHPPPSVAASFPIEGDLPESALAVLVPRRCLPRRCLSLPRRRRRCLSPSPDGACPRRGRRCLSPSRPRPVAVAPLSRVRSAGVARQSRSRARLVSCVARASRACRW